MRDWSVGLPIDPDLADCVGRDGWPLALARFAVREGAADPIEAMQLAVRRLHGDYVCTFGPADRAYHVGKLCRLLGAKLRGSIPIERRTIATNSVSRRRHSGRIVLRDDVPEITVPDGLDWHRARVSVAHEIGHLLMHRVADGVDATTVRLRSTPEEEALAEYAARLLLMPGERAPVDVGSSLSETCLGEAGVRGVTLHAATARSADPDRTNRRVRGAVLWGVRESAPDDDPVERRLTPKWHLCPGAFVPIGRCRARGGSVVAELAALGGDRVSKIAEESVAIGTLQGNYEVDAVAWGSLRGRTRLILSLFLSR